VGSNPTTPTITHDSGSGTSGLGLESARVMLKARGGSMGAENCAEGGARSWLDMPPAPPDAPCAARRAPMTEGTPMTSAERPSRQQLWDERHAARDPIESPGPDPTLAAIVGGLAPGRALDLATGDGRNAIWLAAHGWTVTAVDFSSVALERARCAAASAGVEVDWVLADLHEWRAVPHSFDLVAVMFLHLPSGERRPVYAAAADAVAHEGRILVVGHDRSNLTDGVGGPQDPAVLFTAQEIAAELAGFTIETAELVERDLGDGRRAIDAVVLGRRPLP
jgi:SAM-dependent methyltransferase